MIYFLTVNYYSTLLLTRLIDSLPSNNENNYKVIIINNSPDDESIKSLASQTTLILDAGYNLGFGSACNLGIQWVYAQDTNAIVWLINPDTYFEKTPHFEIHAFFSSYPNVSILGTIIQTPANKIWFAGGRFFAHTGNITTDDLLTNTDDDYIICDWVSGCSLIINLRNFNKCPLFDSNYFLYYEDFDFCRRYACEGHTIAITKLINIVHQPSSITNRDITKKNRHSTYSYLLTLAKYTNKFIFIIRLTRLIAYALILTFIKPKVAFGKFYGVLLFWRNSLIKID